MTLLYPWRACRLLAVWGCLAAMLAAVLAHGAPPGPAVAPLGAGEEHRVLGDHEVSVLRDPGGRLGIEEVTSPAMVSQFQPQSLGLGTAYSNDAVWVRVQVRRAAEAPVQWRLELTSVILDDVRFFAPTPGGGFAVLQAGDHFPFAGRQLPNRRPLFDLRLEDEQPQVFHLRIQSGSTLHLAYVLWQLRAFDASQQRDMLVIGSVLGVTLISMLFFAHAWVMNRDRLLLSAAWVTLAFMFAAATNLGLVSQYLLPHHPQWADAMHPWSMALFFPMLFALFGRALDFKGLLPRLHRVQWVASGMCVLAASLRAFDLSTPLSAKLMPLGLLFGLSWTALAAWLAWRARRRGLYTAVALTALAVSFAVAPMMALGLLSQGQSSELFWVTACVGFILMAQMATLNEVRSARLARRQAEREALSVRRQIEDEKTLREQQSLYFAGVAHDLRTPLGALCAGLTNLERSMPALAPASRDRMTRLHVSARRAADMIERHLQHLQLEHPHFKLEPSRVAIPSFLRKLSSRSLMPGPRWHSTFALAPACPKSSCWTWNSWFAR